MLENKINKSGHLTARKVDSDDSEMGGPLKDLKGQAGDKSL